MRRNLTVLSVLLMAVALLPAPTVAAAGPLPTPAAEDNVDLPPDLTPYHEIAPRLNDIARRSNRVRVEVFGQSAAGRDLYLVTVSDPKLGGRFGKNKQLRNLMLRDPEEALARVGEYDDFKVPVWVNGSIHGDEYEGVDASLDTIERLAFADDPETQSILEHSIVLFNVVQNPDGRVQGTRTNANGFDLNRDFITNSQPETAAVRDALTEWNPMVFLDLHGYVGGYLIEPTTPPHNPNYEYDLYIEHALGQGLAIEQALLELDASVPNSGLDPVIPFRDWEVGDWDDWPPIFAPMYAMYHGAFGHTLESQWRVNRGAVNLPVAERARRSSLNRAAHVAAVDASLRYVAANQLAMVRDQLEVFVRGATSAEPFPVEPGFVPGFGPEDQFVADYPGAYVIPVGDGQASGTAAEMLVDHLVAHGVEVGRSTSGFAAGGRSYPSGSYVVSMAQPRRGLANTMLELGYDISDITPQMYDISGWSHAELWGATVDRIEPGVPLPRTTAVKDAPTPRADLAKGRVGAYAIDLDGLPAIRAVNDLLAAGYEAWRAPDGRIVIEAAARSALNALTDDGVGGAGLPSVPPGSESLSTLTIGTSVGGDARFVLDRLGFELVDISETAISDGGAPLGDIDALVIGSGFDYDDLSLAGQAALQEWFADGGGVLAVGLTGARFNEDAGLLDVTTNRGPRCSTANGIVQVDLADGAPTTAGFPAQDTSFVFGPLWFTDTDGVTVDQSYDDQDVLVAGHWLGDDEPGNSPFCTGGTNNGQTAAAGNAAVVSGVDESGARVVVFGVDPMFRDHPRKLYRQVANALYWLGAR